MRYDVLLVDDEAMLSENTREYFEMFGVKTAWAADADACRSFFDENTADVILLDINLGNASGFDLCKELRRTVSVPILFISARTSDDDMILALNIGGDDYIKKPYSLTVLLAKVNAVIKRQKLAGAAVSGGTGSASGDTEVFESGNLRINFVRRTVFVNGEKIDITAMEYRLLAYLAKNCGRTVSKEELFENVWKDLIVEDNTLNVHIRRLREKIEEDPAEPKVIVTVRGVGYMLE